MQRWQILPPPGRSGSPSPGGGQYHPVNTAALSEFPSTPDTCISPEEFIEVMPLSPSGWGVDDNMAVDGYNEVDARSRGCSHLLALSSQRCRILILDNFWWVVRQRQEEGIDVRCRWNIGRHWRWCCHCRGRFQKQASDGGYMATIWSLSKLVRI